MTEKSIRVYFSGYIEKDIPKGLTDINKIFDIKEDFAASLTPKDIGRYMTEDDWQIYPNGAILR
jgi:hypothetical protein